MKNDGRFRALLLLPWLIGCPTRTIYYDAGTDRGNMDAGGMYETGGFGGAAGTGVAAGTGAIGAAMGGSGASASAGGGSAGSSTGSGGSPASGGSAGSTNPACTAQGTCVCDATSCPNGCCSSNGACILYASQSNTACGNGGGTCASCGEGISCSKAAGVCLGCSSSVTKITEAQLGFGVTGTDGFGSYLAVRNGQMLVDSPSANQPYGRIYAFSGSGASYSYLQYVAPTDPNVTGFGLGVALDRTGSVAIARGTSSNLAYCSFTRTGPNWFAGPEITTGDSGAFGVDDGALAVGGLYAETMFVISSSASQVLKPADFTPSPSNGTFGTPLAISGNTVLIAGEPLDSQGLPGHYGYVFVNSGSTWVQQAKLVPSDLATNGDLSFKFTVAIDGSTAVLASSLGAYVFSQSGSTWTQVQKISTPSGASGFGSAVDLFGNMLVITGAPSGATRGAAYVYARANGTWIAGPVLSSGTNGDNYGVAVGVSQGTVAVGAPAGDGAVYVYSCQPSP